MSQKLAGHLLVECLVEQGITHAFGVPGESYLAVLDGFHAHRDKIRFVINRQEGGAAYMADAQARLAEIVEGLDAAIGFGRHDADSIVVSGRIRDILGYEPEELRQYAHWDALIHPDDMIECQRVWGSSASTWSIEYRMRHSDGHWVWIRDRARRMAEWLLGLQLADGAFPLRRAIEATIPA